MTMQPSHTTLRDETLTHQVILTTPNHTTVISCNCRIVRTSHLKGSRPHYLPIGPTRSIEESRELYNDPENHFAPFTEADRAKW